MITLPHCLVDLGQAEIRSGARVQRLTELEVKLLRHLRDREGAAVSREELLEQVWGYSPSLQSRCVDTTVRRLRRKLEEAPGSPRHLLSVRGHGYRLRVDPGAPLRGPAERLGAPVPGREALVHRILALLERERSVALLGPPGVGRRALALAVAHAFPGPVSLGPSDPVEGLWVRLDGGLGPAQALQLVLPPHPERGGGHELLVPPLEGAAAAPARIPESPPATLGRLAAFAGPVSRWDAQDIGITPADQEDLLARGWLIHSDAGLEIAPCWSIHPSAADRAAHAAWLEEKLGLVGRDAPFTAQDFPELDRRRQALFAALDWRCTQPGDGGLRALYLLNRYLMATTPIERSLAWVRGALDGALDADLRWRVRGEIQLAGLLRLSAQPLSAHAALDRALALGAGEDIGFVTSVRATLLHTEGRHAEALAAYLQAVQELEPFHPERAAIFRAEASVQVLRQGDPERALELARQATRRARALGDPRVLARCEGRLGLVLSRLARSWEAAPRLEASTRSFRALGDHQQLAFGLLHLAEVRVDCEEFGPASAALSEGLALAAELGIPALVAQYQALTGVLEVLRADPARARGFLEEAIRSHEDTLRSACGQQALVWLAVCYADLGLAALAARTVEALTDAGLAHSVRCLLAGEPAPAPEVDPACVEGRLIGRLLAQRAAEATRRRC
ncbi:MAG: helix-turn-helix domain-containing protein [Myxococcota bacterium]|nr:helix-turn-helix domain-containing protein [Myxococcota bacterium]